MGLLYTKMKVFNYKEKIDSLPAQNTGILPPVHLRIKPTNVCNHKCSYCAYRDPGLQLGQNMSIRDFIPREKMIEILEDIRDMGVRAVTFSGGGEPFCYQYFLDTVRFLAETDIKFASLTNGAKLEGEIAEIFAHKGTWIRVSMDGWDDESYTRFRGVRDGEFKKILNNLTRFKKLGGKCLTGVSLIISRDNAGHVYEFINRLKETGIDSIKLSPCIISNSAGENNEYHSPILESVREQATRAVSDFADPAFQIYDTYHLLDDKFQKSYEWCPYLQMLAVIGADQMVYSCQDKAYNEDGLLGSIKDVRFRDFWFSDKNRFFRINPSIMCNHHCVANEKNRLVLEYLERDPEHEAFI